MMAGQELWFMHDAALRFCRRQDYERHPNGAFNLMYLFGVESATVVAPAALETRMNRVIACFDPQRYTDLRAMEGFEEAIQQMTKAYALGGEAVEALRATYSTLSAADSNRVRLT